MAHDMPWLSMRRHFPSQTQDPAAIISTQMHKPVTKDQETSLSHGVGLIPTHSKQLMLQAQFLNSALN